MKPLLLSMFLILSFHFLPQQSRAFDTQNGQYLSEQDLMVVLKDLFSRPEMSDEYMFGEFKYVPSSQTTKHYELGFINLESGQPMVQGPSESYILTIDLFINNTLNFLWYRKLDGFRKHLFSQQMNEYFDKKIKDYYEQTHQQLTFLHYIISFKFSTLPSEMQELFVQDILNFVFLEPALVPQSLKANMISTIVPVLILKDLTIQTAAQVVIKKAIINDHFLKY